MNEYKIQLESKEDLVFLKQEFDNFLNTSVDSASTLSDNLKNQVIFGIDILAPTLFVVH